MISKSPCHELRDALYNDDLINKWLWKVDFCEFNNVGWNVAEQEYIKDKEDKEK